jgi:hypothetical protein
MIAPNFLCQTGAIRDNQNGGDRAKDRCYVGPVQFIHPEIIEYKALISIDPHKDIANFFSQFAKQTPFFISCVQVVKQHLQETLINFT